MDYIETIQTLSTSNLKKMLKELEKEAEQIGKALPKLKDLDREMGQKEYDMKINHINDVRALLQEKGVKLQEKDPNEPTPSTMEKLFPTVTKMTKIINNNKKAKSDEIKEDIPEEIPPIQNGILSDIDEKIKKEFSEINNNDTLKTNTFSNIEKNITMERKAVTERVELSTLSIEEILEMRQENVSDSETAILTTTKEEILHKPIIELTKDKVKTLSKDDAKRDLELAIRWRELIKNEIKKKSISIETEKFLSNKLDILNKNISRLKLVVAG